MKFSTSSFDRCRKDGYYFIYIAIRHMILNHRGCS
nr:MAG TPA: DEATH RECEPTOR 5, DR5, complex, APOPTOSIS.2A [Caudoviricetes sp.]